MMTAGGRKSPVHVHVDRETPVHVHLKKKKKSRPGVPTAVEGYRKSTKSGSPPFIPPPGKTSKRPFTWEGNSHRLEVSPPLGSGTLRMEDLSTSEEEDVNGKIRTYEKKIGSLMTEVGSLKNAVEFERARQVVEKKDEQLNASRRILEEQEDELLGYKQELKATVKENEALRHSVEKWKEDANVTRTEVGKLAGERVSLLKKLVEVEMDGKAAGEQLVKLRDTVRKLKEDKRMSAADTTLLTRQREMLLQKLDEFERTNKGLRRLLREHQESEEDHDHLRKQQEVLLKRLTQSDTTNERLQLEVVERDRQIETLLTQVEADKDQAVAFEELKKTMETTRAHLQNQLRTKEMDSNRLSVQIRVGIVELAIENSLFAKRKREKGLEEFFLGSTVGTVSLEDQCEQGRLELEHMQGLLTAQREKSAREKEALKKAARIQKDRVSEREKDLEVLQEKLADRDVELSETKRAEQSLKEEKGDSELEIKTLKSRVKELHEMVESTAQEAQSNSSALTAKLSNRTQEVSALRLENEQLKADIAALEERLHEEEQKATSKFGRELFSSHTLLTLSGPGTKKVRATQSKLAELLAKLEKYEEMIEDYQSKVNTSETEVTELQNSVCEHQCRIDQLRKQHKSDREEIKSLKVCSKEYEAMLDEYKNQIVSYEVDIRNLKANLEQSEHLLTDHRARCTYNQGQIVQLNSAIKEYEVIFSDYKEQRQLHHTSTAKLKRSPCLKENIFLKESYSRLSRIDRYRREAEETKNRLYEFEADSQRKQQENALENEKVKMKLQQRLQELEPLADLLKSTDARLQESQERMLAYERRSGDHTKLISELTQKVEMQTDHLEHFREKLRMAQDEAKSMQAQNELLERKLSEADQQNRELIGVISKKEESLYQTQQRHEDLRAENIRLGQQLESSVVDARRQVDSQKEKALVKERAAQARITDLEAQLSRATASAAQMKKSKDEAERRYNSKLYDMRDRLDQANSTTRSMQSYVSFLKTSYANVFDDLESPS
ncbi:Outer dense fiber protein 2 [Acropora cervicornis]|uniref:Outer dense fiber protein 2 n=1 Tax=Acropora cervicornis TaxID=6130 RepID=A0AAD9QUE1_ACRCE|nr:Outer dense fiber protein 2 [Acropora cervicornis]